MGTATLKIDIRRGDRHQNPNTASPNTWQTSENGCGLGKLNFFNGTSKRLVAAIIKPIEMVQNHCVFPGSYV